ncbi:hypothetical protein NSK_001275 [Nannochloropsis salina CCMP1776]|uniref:Uncharacterized protein n=1 Tax=Nannochloropsis salina CCMP1776 TaxID=1027361 RepID=A0A4D9DGK2_9STRA|nr:hypothetical protein NSK_001275 [Nannochloropsis salina CCMP1776]|eukprot:TFJ87929.1 hypothetical protein NSK_001275 [Nannochloropsis salina CCMP1776]
MEDSLPSIDEGAAERGETSTQEGPRAITVFDVLTAGTPEAWEGGREGGEGGREDGTVVATAQGEVAAHKCFGPEPWGHPGGGAGKASSWLGQGPALPEQQQQPQYHQQQPHQQQQQQVLHSQYHQQEPHQQQQPVAGVDTGSPWRVGEASGGEGREGSRTSFAQFSSTQEALPYYDAVGEEEHYRSSSTSPPSVPPSRPHPSSWPPGGGYEQGEEGGRGRETGGGEGGGREGWRRHGMPSYPQASSALLTPPQHLLLHLILLHTHLGKDRGGGGREGGRERGREAVIAAQVGVERLEAGRPHQKDSGEGYVADEGVKGGREGKREGGWEGQWESTQGAWEGRRGERVVEGGDASTSLSPSLLPSLPPPRRSHDPWDEEGRKVEEEDEDDDGYGGDLQAAEGWEGEGEGSAAEKAAVEERRRRLEREEEEWTRKGRREDSGLWETDREAERRLEGGAEDRGGGREGGGDATFPRGNGLEGWEEEGGTEEGERTRVRWMWKKVRQGAGFVAWPLLALGSLVGGRGEEPADKAADAAFDTPLPPASLPASLPSSPPFSRARVRESAGGLVGDLSVVWGCGREGGREGGRKAKAVVLGVVGLSVLAAALRVTALVCLGGWMEHFAGTESFGWGMGGKEGGEGTGRRGGGRGREGERERGKGKLALHETFGKFHTHRSRFLPSLFIDAIGCT